LAEFEQQALLSKTLATVRYDVELAVDLEQLCCQKPNLSQLIPLLRQLEFSELEVAFMPPPVGVVELYSDGSGTASGPGGYGVVLRYGEHEKEVSGFEPQALLFWPIRICGSSYMHCQKYIALVGIGLKVTLATRSMNDKLNLLSYLM